MSSKANPESAKPAPRRQPLQFSLRMLLILVTLVAAVSGFFRWRWLNSPEVLLARQRVEFSERFKAVPLVIGAWKGEEIEVTPNVLDAYDSRGAARREYRNTVTGAAIELFVIRGPVVPTAIAPPFSCEEVRRIVVERKCDFGMTPEIESTRALEMKTRSGERYISVVSFSPAGIWSKPDIPRIEFADKKELTQLQLVYSNPAKSSAENWRELEESVPLLFPHLQQVLFPQSKSVNVDSPQWLAETSIPWTQLMITTASIVGLIYINQRRKVA